MRHMGKNRLNTFYNPKLYKPSPKRTERAERAKRAKQTKQAHKTLVALQLSRGLRPFRRGRWGTVSRRGDGGDQLPCTYATWCRDVTPSRQTWAITATIWSYVSACRSAGGDMDLRFYTFERRVWLAGDMDLRLCMFQRRRSYGLTFSHV